jgi:hypothetical protein
MRKNLEGKGPIPMDITTAMTHIAVQEALDGKSVEWMEQVTDEQYGVPRGGTS